MWAQYVLSLLRRRVVLALIFLLSLSYFLLSMLGPNEVVPNDPDDPDLMLGMPVQPRPGFSWHSPDDNSVDNSPNSDPPPAGQLQSNDTGGTNGKAGGNTGRHLSTCRNSVQGRTLVTDDRGYVCNRGDVAPNGCCRVSPETQTGQSQRYSCKSCRPNGCCSVYEYCISCCLHPDKKPLLQGVLGRASQPLSRLFSAVSDHFELCLAKCRTSSQSVQHENLYRDPRYKHCYGDTPPAP